MPYDSVKVRELLRAAPQHRAMPNAELVLDLAEQLGFAEQTLAEMAVKIRKAHEETAAGQARLDAVVESERKLRGETAGYAQVISALRSIAGGARGAAKIAAAVLPPESINP